MEFIQSLILAIVGSSALSATITSVVTAIHSRKSKESKLEAAKTDAIMFLLADSIRRECQEHINAGEISAEDLKRLDEEWVIYHNELGGNGFLDAYRTDIRALPKKRTA